MIAFNLAAPARLVFPVLTTIGPWKFDFWAWRELRPGHHGWSIARRHAEMVRKRRCHYEQDGTLHCRPGCSLHKQGVEYGRMSRVMKIA